LSVVLLRDLINTSSTLKALNMRFFLCGRPIRWALLLACVTVFCAVGCGRKAATVSGKVTFNGEPLKGGNVTFARNDGKPSISGRIEEDGSYKLENVPVGTTKICVETKSLNPAAATGPKQIGAGGGGGPMVNKPPPDANVPAGYDPEKNASGGKAKFYVAIPEKYGDPSTTDLSYDVKPGNQEYTIPLTK
jgi:hypothetical protein